MYKALDVFFVVLHTSLILFNLFGWIWKPLRKLNLITLLLTGSSWFILGIFYGIGYCPLTDWHWQILRKLGKYDLPNSYIEYLVERLTGLDVQTKLTDNATMILYFTALIISLVLNILKRK